MNNQSFDISTKKGRQQFDAFLKVLLDYNAELDNRDYNEIHIYQEETFMIVEWDKVPYNHEWGGTFQYIDYDDVVMKEVAFPDGHYERLLPDEVEEALKNWHLIHPEWVKTSYGTWTNMEENRRASIDWHSKEWMKREVKENDISFSESVFEFEQGEAIDLEQVFGAVDTNILRRTEYVVMSRKIAHKLDKYGRYYIQDDLHIIKLNDWEKLSAELGEEDYIFSVYITDYLTDDAIYYVTDTNYLIHREKVEVKE